MNWLNFPLTNAHPWVGVGLECAVAMTIGLVVHALLSRFARRLAGGFVVAGTLVAYGHRPLQWILPMLLVNVVLSDAPDSLLLIHPLRHLLSIAQLAALTFLWLRLVQGVRDALISLHPADVADNLRARSVLTQTQVVSRVVMTLIAVLGAASILMTFPGVRQLGAGLFASAGVAGLVAGIAARPVLGNLIAGLQIALTQPIRLDDVLIVQDEWGRVEEITGSYVTLRLWDERRLVVPLEWFIQNPFQNWTRSSAQLIGAVLLWVDFAMPLDPLRQELERVCRAAPEWDGRVCVLQATDANEQALQVRALVSAGNASQAWDLRCRVREALVTFMRTRYAACLPRQRASFANDVHRAPGIG